MYDVPSIFIFSLSALLPARLMTEFVDYCKILTDEYTRQRSLSTVEEDEEEEMNSTILDDAAPAAELFEKPEEPHIRSGLMYREKIIDSLKKENFTFKLRIYFLEERLESIIPGFKDIPLKESEELRLQIQTLKHSLQLAQSQVQHLTAENATLLQTNETLVQQRVAGVENEIGQTEEYEYRIAQLADKITELTNANNELSEANARLVSINAHLTSELDNANTDLTNANDEVNKTNAQLINANNKLNDTNNELHELKNQLESLKLDHEAQIKSLQNNHDYQIQAIETAHQSQIQSLQTTHENHIETLQSAHETAILSLEKDLASSYQLSIDEKLQEMEAIIDSETETLTQTFNAQLAELTAAKDEERQREVEDVKRIWGERFEEERMLRITIEQERVNLEKSSGELLSDLQNHIINTLESQLHPDEDVHDENPFLTPNKITTNKKLDGVINSIRKENQQVRALKVELEGVKRILDGVYEEMGKDSFLKDKKVEELVGLYIYERGQRHEELRLSFEENYQTKLTILSDELTSVRHACTEKIKDCECQVKIYQDNFQHLETRYEELNKEYQGQIQTYESKVVGLNKELEDTKNAHEMVQISYESKLSVLNKQLADTKNAYEMVQRSVGDYESKISVLNKQLDDTKNAYEMVQISNRDYESKISVLNKQLDDTKNAYELKIQNLTKDSNEMKNQYQKTLTHLNEELNEARFTLNNYEKEVEELYGRLEDEKKASTIKLDQLVSCMEEYEEKLKIVNDQVEESIFDYAQLEKRNGELTEQVERLTSESQSTESQSAEKHQIITQLRAECARIQKSLHESKQTIAALQSANQASEAALVSELREAALEMQGKVEELSREIEVQRDGYEKRIEGDYILRISKLEQENSGLIRDVEGYRTKCQSILDEKEKMRIELSEIIRGFERERSGLIGDVEEYRTKYQSLLDEKEKMAEELSEKIRGFERENSGLIGDVEGYRTKYQSLLDEKEKMRVALETVSEKLRVFENENMNLNEAVEDYTLRIQDYQSQIKEYTTSIQEYESQIQEYETQLQNQKNLIIQQKGTLSTNLTQITQEFTLLQSTTSTKIHDLTSQNQSLRTQIQNLTTANAQTHSEALADRDRQIEDANASIVAIKCDYAMVLKEVDGLKKGIAELREELDEKNVELQKVLGDFEVLNGKTKHLELYKLRTTDKIPNLTKDLEQSRTKCKELEELVEDLEKDSDEKGTLIKGLKEQIKRVKEKNNELTPTLVQYESALATKQDELLELEAANEKMEKELLSFKKKYNSLKLDYEEQTSKLDQQENHSLSEVTRLRKKSIEDDKKISKLKETIMDMEMEKNSFIDEIQEHIASIDKLTLAVEDLRRAKHMKTRDIEEKNQEIQKLRTKINDLILELQANSNDKNMYEVKIRELQLMLQDVTPSRKNSLMLLGEPSADFDTIEKMVKRFKELLLNKDQEVIDRNIRITSLESTVKELNYKISQNQEIQIRFKTSHDDNKVYLYSIYESLGQILGGSHSISNTEIQSNTAELKKQLSRRLEGVLKCRNVFQIQINAIEKKMDSEKRHWEKRFTHYADSCNKWESGLSNAKSKIQTLLKDKSKLKDRVVELKTQLMEQTSHSNSQLEKLSKRLLVQEAELKKSNVGTHSRHYLDSLSSNKNNIELSLVQNENSQLKAFITELEMELEKCRIQIDEDHEGAEQRVGELIEENEKLCQKLDICKKKYQKLKEDHVEVAQDKASYDKLEELQVVIEDLENKLGQFEAENESLWRECDNLKLLSKKYEKIVGLANDTIEQFDKLESLNGLEEFKSKTCKLHGFFSKFYHDIIDG